MYSQDTGDSIAMDAQNQVKNQELAHAPTAPPAPR
jgi:hypothetical protein